jgi:hypothetical protein
MEYVVYVDSNNRNQTMYPNSNSYTLHLATPIRNIARAELVSAMLPSLNVSQFVCLDILELRSPQHQTADALVRSTTANVMTVTSNSFNGSFAVLPVKVSGTYEFYNQNYRIGTKYPYAIDTLDRLTITWRQPNNGTPYYDTVSNLDLGRNMFLLRFETVVEDLKPDRPMGLPDPVEWDYSGEKNRLWIIAFVAVAGLLIIVSMQRGRAAKRELIMKAQTQ